MDEVRPPTLSESRVYRFTHKITIIESENERWQTRQLICKLRRRKYACSTRQHRTFAVNIRMSRNESERTTGGKTMKIVHHDPVVNLTVIIDKIGFKWYEKSTVPIRVN